MMERGGCFEEPKRNATKQNKKQKNVCVLSRLPYKRD